MYKYEFPGIHRLDPSKKPMDFTEFLDSLAYDLIHGDPDGMNLFEPRPVIPPRSNRSHRRKRAAVDIADHTKGVRYSVICNLLKYAFI